MNERIKELAEQAGMVKILDDHAHEYGNGMFEDTPYPEMDKFVELGFIDTFRAFNAEAGHYSWWSYRANSREKNLGWRIDYHMASKELQNKLKSAVILPDVVHSDHCPVVLELH